MIKPIDSNKYCFSSENDFIDYLLKGKIFNERILVPPSIFSARSFPGVLIDRCLVRLIIDFAVVR